MVCNTQKHWVCGLCPSSGTLNTRKHIQFDKSVFQLFRILDDAQSPENPLIPAVSNIKILQEFMEELALLLI
jgi:hypothetical protein